MRTELLTCWIHTYSDIKNIFLLKIQANEIKYRPTQNIPNEKKLNKNQPPKDQITFSVTKVKPLEIWRVFQQQKWFLTFNYLAGQHRFVLNKFTKRVSDFFKFKKWEEYAATP